MEILLEVAHAFSPVREKDELLIHLQALPFQQFEQAPFRFGIERADKPKAYTGGECLVFIPREREHALADNDFKPPLFPWRAHEPAINPHGQRPIGGGQAAPVPWTAVNETALLCAQGILRALGHTKEMIAEGDRIEL